MKGSAKDVGKQEGHRKSLNAVNDNSKPVECEERQSLAGKLPKTKPEQKPGQSPTQNRGAAKCEGNQSFLARTIPKFLRLWHFWELLSGKLPRCHGGS